MKQEIEINRLNYKYFLQEVADRQGISVKDLETVYLAYMKQLEKNFQKDVKFVIRSIGTIEFDLIRALRELYNYDRFLESLFIKGSFKKMFICLDKIEIIETLYKNILETQHRHKYYEKAFQKFTRDNKWIKKFFDNNGDYKGGIKETFEDMFRMRQEARNNQSM